MTQHIRLSEISFNYSVQLKKLFETHTAMRVVTSTDGDARGARLPRLEVPMFDGNMLNWRNFWEQVSMSTHSCSSLSPVEKPVYLQQALKDWSSQKHNKVSLAVETTMKKPFATSRLSTTVLARYTTPM